MSLISKLGHRLAAEFAILGLVQGSNNKKISRYRNAYRGQRCFILGNGPSLKKQDLSGLRNEHVFCSNWFVLHEEFPNMGSCFFTVSDPHLWNFGEGFHPELLEAMRVRPDIHCFFESSARASWQEQDVIDHDKAVFLRLDRKKTCMGRRFFNQHLRPCRLGLHRRYGHKSSCRLLHGF